MTRFEGWTGDSFGAVGSSHVPLKRHAWFLGGKRPVMVMTYPTERVQSVGNNVEMSAKIK